MRVSTPSSKARKYLRLSPLDLTLLFLSPFLSLAIRGSEFIEPGNFPASLPPTYEYALLTFLTSLPFFLFFRTSDSVSHFFSARDILSIAAAVLCSVSASVYTVFSLNRLEGVPRTVPVIYGLILIVGLISSRIIARALYERQEGAKEKINRLPRLNDIRRVIIIGLDPFSTAAIRLMNAQNPHTVQVVAIISLDGKYADRTISGVRVLTDLSDLETIIEEYRIHGVALNEVWLSDNSNNLPLGTRDHLQRQSDKLGLAFKKMSEALNLTPIDNSDEKNREFYETAYDAESAYLKIRHLVDVFLSAIIALILIPIYPLVGLIALFDVGAPIMFWQLRTGWRGHKFLLYKIRTLREPLDDEGNIRTDEERMSKLGALLRTSRLDEIPQILSVLVGDMSLIGPRPLLPRDEPQDNRRRLSVRPGITGWAQVHGNELLNPDERNALDCWYINKASLFIDTIIIIKTINVIMHGSKRDEKAIVEAMRWMKS
jgi:lipopolysaccharide/colanic/teichoic acid biosynthesis glycosyltransferase